MRESKAAVLAESRKTKHVSVDSSMRACINCRHYEQYFHQSRGNVAMWVPTCEGYCLKKEQKRGALRQPCKDFLK